MIDKIMKVSLRMAFTMTGFSDVKPLYERFVVQINGHEWQEGAAP